MVDLMFQFLSMIIIIEGRKTFLEVMDSFMTQIVKMISWVYTHFQSQQVVYTNYIQIFACREKASFQLFSTYISCSWQHLNQMLKIATTLHNKPLHRRCLPHTIRNQSQEAMHYILPVPLFHEQNSRYYWNCHQILFQGLEDFSSKSDVLSGIPF